MKILSSPKGLVLIFESLKELQGTIKNLSGMLEWIETEDVPPPHLYSVFDDRIPHEEINEMLDEIKKL